jgi:hypothetical protein
MSVVKFSTVVACLALSPTAAIGEEWVLSPHGSAAIVQGDARLNIICDTDHGRALEPGSLGKILIFVKEPRANWTKFAKVEVKTTPDDGPPAKPQPSEGTALSPTSLVIEDDATWELNEMGSAKTTFKITAGAFSRTYSASRLREVVALVLERCGESLVTTSRQKNGTEVRVR